MITFESVTKRYADLAFSGDVLQGAGFPNSSSALRSVPMYVPLSAYHESLEVVRSLSVSTLCTAHEGVLEGEEVEADRAAFALSRLHANLWLTARPRPSPSLRETGASFS